MRFLASLLKALALLHGSEESSKCVQSVISEADVRQVYAVADSSSLMKDFFLRNISVTSLADVPRHSPSSRIFVFSVQINSFLDYFEKPIDPKGKYILSLESDNRTQIEVMMATFWSHKAYDITVICNGTIYSSAKLNCDLKKMYIMEESCDNEFIEMHDRNNENCPLRINWVPKEPYFIENKSKDGIEYLILVIISNILKKNIVWYKEDFKGYFENGTWHGALGNMKDAAAGGFIMSQKIYNDYLLTYPHFYDSYRWYVPFLNPVKSYEQINLLSWSNHLLFFVYIVICFRLMCGTEKAYNSPTKCALNVFRIGLGISLRKTPKRNHMRILFISWVVFQMHTTTIYSSNLTEKLVRKLKSGPVKSKLEERKCVSVNVEYRKTNDESSLYRCNLTEIVHKMTSLKNFSLLAGEEQMDFAVRKGKALVGKKGSRYLVRYNTFVFPINSEYFTKVNKIIWQIFESGIYMKIRRDIYYEYAFEEAKEYEELDLTLLYGVLFGGWTLGFILFICEILLARLKIFSRK